MNHLFSFSKRLVNKINIFLIITTYLLIQSCTGLNARRVSKKLYLKQIIKDVFNENTVNNKNVRCKLCTLLKKIKNIDKYKKVSDIIEKLGQKWEKEYKKDKESKDNIIIKLNYPLIEKKIRSMKIKSGNKFTHITSYFF